ncbi:MAG TPA: replication-relaxation family protein [Micromonosporaceae bacterium]|nr:replication-relaxation family protein [Micromonosporaceae bacterium]
MSATSASSSTSGLSSPTPSSPAPSSPASLPPVSPSPAVASPAAPSASNPRRRPTRVPPAPGKPGPFDPHRRLTSRDRLLLSWLAEHYLLSSVQIARALFTNPRTARLRLTILARLGFLTAIPSGRDDGAPQPWLYTLGPLGLHLHPRAYHDPDNLGLRPPRSSVERARRIIASPQAQHFLGVNQFFVDLHAHTRSHPHARLARWWSERHATDTYSRADIHPDGHGIWHVDSGAGNARVGFFLELDRSTENLARVIGKLRGYETLARFGPRYPVLLWVPDRHRETSLLRALDGVPTAMPVATAVQQDNSAGPIWALATDPFQRRALHQLPSHPGPDASTNPDRPQAQQL